MAPEHAVVLDADDVVRVFGIVLAQVQQDLQFDSSLMLELLLVANDLDGHDFASLVILALESLSKRALSKEVKDLKAVGNVIAEHDVVIASLVIVPVVELVVLGAFDLL